MEADKGPLGDPEAPAEAVRAGNIVMNAEEEDTTKTNDANDTEYIYGGTPT